MIKFKYLIIFLIFLILHPKISISQSKREINKLIDEAITHGKQSVYTNSDGQTPTFYTISGVDSKNPKYLEALRLRGFSTDNSLVDIQYLTSSSYMQYLRGYSNSNDGLLFFDSKFILFFNELKPIFENINATFYCARMGAEPCIYITIKQMVSEKPQYINIFKNYCFWKYSIKGCTDEYITSQCYRLAKEIKEAFPNDNYPISDAMLEKTKLYYKDKDEASYRFLTNMTKSLETFVSSPSNSNSTSSSSSSNNSTDDKNYENMIAPNYTEKDWEKTYSTFDKNHFRKKINFSGYNYWGYILRNTEDKYFIEDQYGTNYYYKDLTSAINALWIHEKYGEFIKKNKL